jgi:hypothetical protein
MENYSTKGRKEMNELNELIKAVEKSIAALERALEERQDEPVDELALLCELPARLLTCYNKIAGNSAQ